MSEVHRLITGEIESVELFKRDQLASDVTTTDGLTLFYHGDLDFWRALTARLEELDDFHRDWFSHFSQPPFTEGQFIASQSAAQ